MARGKQYDEHLLIEFARRHSAAAGRAERADAIQWFIERTGASHGTAYRVLARMKAGDGLASIAEARQARKTRKHDIERAREMRDAKIVAAIKMLPGKKAGKWIPTARALQMAGDVGLIEKGKYTRSTMDRLLAKMGINRKSAHRRHAAHELTTTHSMRVLVVDATPIDHYYLRLDRSVQRYDTPDGDKHLDDILVRERLSKIWVYYGVDLFSKAFLAMPFASLPKGAHAKNPGESADDWYEFLKFFCLPKRGLPSPVEGRPHPLANCPIEGLPVILYCDKGSGIGGSKVIQNVFGNLGVKVVNHMPKNPSAKGMVEGRISAFKRSFETQLLAHTVHDINRLIYFYLSWCDYWNRERGYYEAFLRGTQEQPLRRVTEQNFRDGSVVSITKTINQYGCVEIDRDFWFVGHDEKYIRTKATVYRHPPVNGELTYTARLYDNTIVWCTRGKFSHDFEDIKSFPKSAGRRNLEEAEAISGGFKNTAMQPLVFEDTLPPDRQRKVVHFPPPVTPVVTHSPAAPARFATVNAAWNWILNEACIFQESLDAKSIETITHVLTAAHEKHGQVPGEVAVLMANLINQNKEEEVSGEH